MRRFHTFETIINMQPNTKTMNLKSILMNFSKHFNHKKKKKMDGFYALQTISQVYNLE